MEKENYKEDAFEKYRAGLEEEKNKTMRETHNPQCGNGHSRTRPHHGATLNPPMLS